MATVTTTRTLPGGNQKMETVSGAPVQLLQSRETGEVDPRPKPGERPAVAKSWAHFVAGGVGGMTAATLTAPLDVLKTRLQSDFYQAQLRASRAAHVGPMNPLRTAVYHFNETASILAAVYKVEGPRALFKGLGPNLVGVVPARAINFFTYGNSKRLLAQWFNDGKDDSTYIHLSSAMIAGVVTSTATNPIWMVKTRLQLDKNLAAEGGIATRQYKNSLDCIKQVLRNEGIYGLYKGMSASYLGVAESTLQWVLYERAKKSLARREERLVISGKERTWWDTTVSWMGNASAAGGAKLIAAILTYPHEVARTRLRQAPMADGRPKYTGLVQCFKLVAKEEGMVGLYGGMTPHLLRTVPSAAIMFGMYEGILRLLQPSHHEP
ncbi:Pyrimidine nucleotide transporter, mitochondrial [Podospora pseudopauciseta]|uniref:Pyrimidine nucleotide transporter, mitochondrial n=1 Tax=Podospora pseudopauciseta TaxID=2093780 RepID=A0ABR0I301_9PEZI|nr:Pyrimidine nucleotide transporter, mitochondrial [Podospora pseudopauciseta]